MENESTPDCGMFATPQKEHEWLQQLLGEWTCESEAKMGPDAPPSTSRGTETVRSLGGLWYVADGQMEMPDGDTGNIQMTLGYDPEKGRYVGTWIGSMMTHMWQYVGEIDTDGKVLTLTAEGPDMSGSGGMATYQDIIEILSPDHRTLSSQVQGPDGSWNRFMTAHYRRKA